MDISVQVGGFLKRYLSEPRSLSAQEWEGRDITELLAALGVPASVSAVALVNGRRRRKGYLLQTGDVVKLIPLMTGG